MKLLRKCVMRKEEIARANEEDLDREDSKKKNKKIRSDVNA